MKIETEPTDTQEADSTKTLTGTLREYTSSLRPHTLVAEGLPQTLTGSGLYKDPNSNF
jgi:hypothetical protein